MRNKVKKNEKPICIHKNIQKKMILKGNLKVMIKMTTQLNSRACPKL